MHVVYMYMYFLFCGEYKHRPTVLVCKLCMISPTRTRTASSVGDTVGQDYVYVVRENEMLAEVSVDGSRVTCDQKPDGCRDGFVHTLSSRTSRKSEEREKWGAKRTHPFR